MATHAYVTVVHAYVTAVHAYVTAAHAHVVGLTGFVTYKVVNFDD